MKNEHAHTHARARTPDAAPPHPSGEVHEATYCYQ